MEQLSRAISKEGLCFLKGNPSFLESGKTGTAEANGASARFMEPLSGSGETDAPGHRSTDLPRLQSPYWAPPCFSSRSSVKRTSAEARDLRSTWGVGEKC